MKINKLREDRKCSSNYNGEWQGCPDFFCIADRAKGIPEENTLFNIGSISKVYCTAAVMLLVDEGRIEIDKPIITYLPEFKSLMPEIKISLSECCKTIHQGCRAVPLPTLLVQG